MIQYALRHQGHTLRHRRRAALRGQKRLWIYATLGIMALLLLAESVFWKAYYPLFHVRTVETYAREYGLDPFLLAAVVRVESGYDRWAVSSKGARGLMQVMPETGYWAAEILGMKGFDPDHLFEPEVNLRIGTWYLARLYREFDGSRVLALAAYNSGATRVREWLAQGDWDGTEKGVKDIPYPETREFVIKVLGHAERYRRLYRKTITF